MMKLLTIFSLYLVCNVSILNAQGQVSGLVTSSGDGTALPGVTVFVPGTNIGAVTDMEGKYSINVPEGNTSLNFSFIGYKVVEVEVSGRSIIDVALEPQVYDFNEVIVVGYGSTIKSELTGAISKISSDDFQKTPATNFETALQGKSPGVFMSSTTGKLGEAYNINVRGISSISANTQPLFVIDGVLINARDISTTDNQPVNPLITIDPRDIETIEILKDASASAIYGSRASNGVILITTKSGKKELGNRINFGYSYSLQRETNRIDMMNAEEYMKYFVESTENAEWYGDYGFETPLELVEYFLGLEPGDSIKNYDWQDEMFRRAMATDVYLNAIGGTENSAYFAGLSYTTQEGILVGNNFERFSGRLNFSQNINKYVDFSARLNYAQTSLDRVSSDNAFSTPMQLIAQAPVINPYLEDGSPNPGTTYFNSLLALWYNTESQKLNRTISNVDVNVKIIPEMLRFTSTLGVDMINQLEQGRISPMTDDGLPAGKGFYRTVSNSNYTFDNFLTFDKKFLDLHTLAATAGLSYQEEQYSRGGQGANVYPGDAFLDLDAAAESWFYGSKNRTTTYLSYFSRVNYKLLDRYLLALSFRRDGSSRFGKRFGDFYSVSAGWIASPEAFLANLDWLSFFKPRISYGTTGNANIPDFGYLNLSGPKTYAGTAGLYAEQLGYKTLAWESANQFDAGIDFGFLNNRISGEIDYYVKNTTNLLLRRPIPLSNGINGIYENVGAMKNSGIEFLVNARVLASPIIWDMSFNVATNTNKVTDLVEPFGYTEHRVEKGKPLGFFYMPEYAGVDPSNGDALFYMEDGETTSDYNEAEWRMVGNPNPKYFGGFTNMFSYKGFELNVFFQFVADVDVYKRDGKFMSANGDWFDNQTRDQLNSWKNEDDITDVPQARLGLSNGTQTSSRYVQDASYIRLKDLTLAYNIPSNIISMANIKAAKVYIATKNLLTFTKYTGYDPEVSAPDSDLSDTQVNVIRGIDYYSTPQARIVTFGIDVTF